ncbi:MAG: hypothetical protein NVSMB38_23900 [Ktedonobacteraceae bacterium]
MRKIHTMYPIGAVTQGRYVVEDRLGKEEYSITYLVKDERDSSHRFVLKGVRTQDKGRKGIPLEIIALKHLHHPALPRIHQVLRDNTHGYIYVLIDYVEGSSLDKLLSEQPEHRFSLLQVMSLIAPVMDALMYLHNQEPSIIHQNINPANMFVSKTGGGTVLVGLGFAQAHETDATIVLSNATGYTAPELCSRNRSSSPQTDIYALGATLYTLLTGIVPANALYRLRQLLEKDFDPLKPVNQIIPAIPPYLSQVIHRAMSVSSSERFSTVEQFWESLWQMATITTEAQQFSSLVTVPANEGKNELDANPGTQQIIDPENDDRAEKMPQSHTDLAEGCVARNKKKTR